MKTLKVYDDVHTSVKVAAAQMGITTTNVASSMLRRMFSQIASGEITLHDIQPSDGTADEEEPQTAHLGDGV
jgi:hypothetical protein